jgi:acyl-CoA synthetase (AMP-forming)/AMP-acid ligase II
VGFDTADTDLHLVDPDDPGRVVDPGEAGELVVSGPQVSLGYLNADGRLDRASWLTNGGFRTGDLVERDSLGRFRIVGRLKNIIKYKGYSVAPAELEALLGGHPDILDCAVVGRADAEVGEIPTAFIVLRRDHRLSSDDIIAFVRERVAPQRRIRDVVFVAEIPRSGAGKVLTRELLGQT